MGKREMRRQILPAIKLCCIYDPKDEMYCNELIEHLTALKRQGLLEIWEPREMLPGVIQGHEIDIRLSSSDIVLLLVSRYFFKSDPHWNMMERALELHTAGKVYVVPVSARPYDYEATPLGKLQILPRKKPLSLLSNRDEGYVEVVKGVRQVVLKLQHHREDANIADEQLPGVSSFEQVVLSSSPNPSLFVEQGDILFTRQRYDEALTAYENALLLDPTCLAAYQGKVQVLEEIRLLVYENLYQLTVQPSERTKAQDDIQEDLE